MLASLENETIFKKAFTDKAVFTRFVKDILGIDFIVGSIETEKKFEPKPGDISISYDIFAESLDHRVMVEIQRVDYDYNFDRFLHYHMMSIAELQRNAKEYRIEKTVYTVVVMTAPYKIMQKTGEPVIDEVMISSVDPRNLKDRVINLYGHRLVFLNPHFVTKDTPQNYRDWLDLLYESSHSPNNFKVNLKNGGVRKAVEIIDYDNLGPELIDKMKIDNQRKAMLKIVENEGFEKGKQIGIEEGFEKGIEEGIEKGKIEMAIKMKAKGIGIDIISEMSGLPVKEIEKLGS
ncbi:MAG TPA: Rpn family recombination-promoting nuclease/putative transposase [Candidatus Kapabacteria bacterium]|nr:Rpn family recombination-promoting nuclease/putative transposase [Candidatus Kapabacteria bacterium]